MITRNNEIVDEQQLVADVLLTFAAAADLYGPPASLPFQYYGQDLRKITRNPAVRATALGEFIKDLMGSQASQTEEALRRMLTAQAGANYRLNALLDRVLREDTKSYASAFELLGEFAAVQRAANTDLWGVMPVEAEAAFNDLDAGSLSASLSMKTIRLLASTLFLSDCRRNGHSTCVDIWMLPAAPVRSMQRKRMPPNESSGK